MTITLFFGLLCIAGALSFIFFGIDELQLGEYSSKLLASIFTFIAYYSIAINNVFFSVESAISLNWLVWLIPILLSAFTIFIGVKLWQNRKEETKAIIEASWKLLIVVAFMVAARFLFSLN